MTCLDEPREKGRWPVNFERVGRSKLLLISDKHDLLGINGSKEGFVLLDHRGLINDHSREALVPQVLCAGLSHSRHNDWPLAQDLVLKLSLVPHEFLELGPFEHFNRLDIVANEV